MGASIDEILDDFKSIKLPPSRREFINRASADFMRIGTLNIDTQDKLRKMHRMYRKQIAELHEARERARFTMWRKSNGVTMRDAAVIAERNREKRIIRKEDLGI